MAVRKPQTSKDGKRSNKAPADREKRRLTQEDREDLEVMDQAERDYRLGLGGSIDEVFAAVYRARGEPEPAQRRTQNGSDA